MKRILLLITIATLLCGHSLGQSGNHVIAIVIPAQSELDGAQKQNLESIVTDIMTQSGYMSSYRTTGLVMKPLFLVEEEDVLRSTVNSLYVVNVKLSLNISNVGSEQIFTSVSKRYQGTGRDRRAAISNALAAISVTDSVFGNFLKKGQRIITRYYDDNAQRLFQRASLMVNRGGYEAAIALLMSVPEEALCYEEAVEQSKAYYQLYLSANCSEAIRRANLLRAGHQYREALEFLSYADIRTTECAEEADALADLLDSRISNDERTEREANEVQRNLEAHHLRAMLELANRQYEDMLSILRLQ